jgi:hypothetical protein
MSVPAVDTSVDGRRRSRARIQPDPFQLSLDLEPPRALNVRLMSVDEIYDNLDAALLEKLEEDNRFGDT